jgi:hypothetical protein
MSGASIRIGSVAIGITAALVVIGMITACVVTTEGPAWAASIDVELECAKKVGGPCVEECNRTFKTRDLLNACHKQCAERVEICINVEMEPSKKSTTGTGNTAAPTSKAGQNIGKASGVKKDPMNVQPVIQSDSDNAATPKTKNVGKAGGVTNVWENQSSQSTSGSTIMMKRSGSDKKH